MRQTGSWVRVAEMRGFLRAFGHIVGTNLSLEWVRVLLEGPDLVRGGSWGK